MPVIEPLQSYHDRKGFDCGKESLNLFLQRLARQNADRNVGVTRVVTSAPGDSRILGYYTLVTRTIESSIIPAKKLPSGQIGVVLLGRLGVDKTAQGQGIGKKMLIRAMSQTGEAARNIGIFALVLDTLDEDARRWYMHLDWGFEALLDDPNHLFITVDTIQELGLLED